LKIEYQRELPLSMGKEPPQVVRISPTSDGGRFSIGRIRPK